MLVWCQMCPRAWDLVYHKPIVRDVTPCSSDITLCSAKSIISCFFLVAENRKCSAIQAIHLATTLESLVNFSLIWYTA